jgi:hypothetical protein
MKSAQMHPLKNAKSHFLFSSSPRNLKSLNHAQQVVTRLDTDGSVLDLDDLGSIGTSAALTSSATSAASLASTTSAAFINSVATAVQQLEDIHRPSY